VLEVITPCPTIFGRYNRLGSAVSMLKQQRDSLISMHEAQGMSPEELQGKARLGVFVDLEKPEYCAAYEELIERAQKA